MKLFIIISITLILFAIFFYKPRIKENFYNSDITKYIDKLDLYVNNTKNSVCRLNTRRDYSKCCFIDKNKYEFKNLLNDYYNSHPQKIEKILHQIWIGPKPVPYKWINTFKEYIKNNTDWKYILWRDSDIESLNMINHNIYKIEKSYCGKADIARLEILYRYGGIYIDADATFLGKDLNDLIEKTNKSGIFLGRENKKDNSLANGTIGASKNNPLMLYAIKVMNKIYNNCKHLSAYKSVGPYFCDRIFLDMPITIFPYYYFYPIYWHNKIKPNKHTAKKIYPNSYMYHHGYATHGL